MCVSIQLCLGWWITQLYLGRWMIQKDDLVINIGREPFIGLIPEVT